MSSDIPKSINFSICLIGKNEEKTIPRLVSSMGNFITDGGEVILLDTGSTDKTVETAKSLGMIVHEVGERFITIIDKNKASKLNKKYIVDVEDLIFKAGEKVFDFGGARQLAHSYAKNDMILCVDCSDVFKSFDYKFLNEIVGEGKKTKFNYNMLNGEGPSAVKVGISRFYSRKQFQWKCRIHECLYGNFHVNQVFNCPDDILLTCHIKSYGKQRNYCSGMASDIANKTHLSRSVYYLGREFYYFGRWKSAIKLLKQLVEIKDTWQIELSNAHCIIGECYEHLNDIESAVLYYNKAFDLYPNRRVPLIRLGYLYDKLGLEEKDIDKKNLLYRKALVYATGALEIPAGLSAYEEDQANYSYRPHEIIYRALSNLGDKVKGRIHYQKATELSQGAEWMKCHAQFFEERL